jgi:thiol-disulfide isomerase/thioredoxin
MSGVAIVIAVLVLAAIVGLVMSRRNGRLRHAGVDSSTASVFAVLPEARVDGSAQVTAIQFSSAFCQPCRATRAILEEVSHLVDGLAHVEIDAESHLDQVRALDIRRTPTVVFVDAAGIEFARASGQPRKADVIATVAQRM